MADRLLFRNRQFRQRLAAREIEIRVIAEAARTARLLAHASDTRPFRDEFRAVRVVQDEHAAKSGSRFDSPPLLKLCHELLVVRRIIVPPRVTRRVNARCTAQDFDLQSRVVSKARASRPFCIKARLDARVPLEGRSVLNSIGKLPKILEGQKLHGELLKSCKDFLHLALILRSDYDLLHPIRPTFQTSSPPSASFSLAINSSMPFSASARSASISLREKGRPSPVPCTSTKS